MLPVLVLLLLAFVLRVYHLDFQSLWGDEGISLVRAGLPFREMMQSLPREHVPGYWLVLGAWLSASGTTDFALRYLSLIPSVLAVAIAYRLAADLGSRRAGLVAALLLSTSEFQVWYAQEARMYSWLAMAGIGSTWLLWRLLNARRRALILLGYVLLVSIAINLHFYGFLIPLAQTVFVAVWFWHTRRLRAVLYWGAAGVAVLLLYLPWWSRLLGASAFEGCCPALDPALLPSRFFVAYTTGDAMPSQVHNILPWVYLVLVPLGIWGWSRRNLMGGVLLASAAIVPLVAALAIAAITRDFYHERYGIFLSIPLLMLVGGGFLAFDRLDWGVRTGNAPVGRRPAPGVWLASLVLAVLVGANLAALWRLYTDSTVQKTDFRAIVRRIEAAGQPGDLILVHGLNPKEILMHYYQGDLPVHDVNSLVDAGDAEVEAALSGLTAGSKRVWMLHYSPPTTAIEYWLAGHAWLADRTKYGNENLALSVYGLPGLPQRDVGEGSAFGPQLQMARASVAGGEGDGRSFRAGDLVEITTEWNVLEPPPSLNFSLRLVDSQERVWLSSDYVPLEGSAPTQTWRPGSQVEDRRGLLLPPDLPSGMYSIVLMLYDPESGVPVRVGEQDSATLTTLDISPATAAPDPASLLIPKRLNRRLGDEIELLGYEITPQPLLPGQQATLTLWWRALAQPSEAYRIRIEGRDAGSEPVLARTFPLSDTVEEWQPGQVVRERYDVEVNPAVATGPYRVDLVVEAADGRDVGGPLSLGPVTAASRPRLYRMPRVTHPLEVSFGDAVLLRGYDLTRSQAPQEGVALTLYWQVEQRVPEQYKVFVHLVDDGGRIVAQADSIPADGLAPTDSWLPGEVVIDRHMLATPEPGRYHLLAGLYDPTTGRRVAALDHTGDILPDGAAQLGDVDIFPAK